ncbi:hypothetical protein OJ996_21185 [Luteolibacter sp. GHJ8]|uniref:Uncharacterized protein n=1 Tax=Luteolibacter rhizosphaerae TaxID=2989719 RepID=A0ABT3G8E1_9BACT|nr:hypothetical protein [Luteolibacter rhizosphaerae]MCW1916117.1 hypothetical protein [Luteolibacter rhizosphaerae]
MTKARTLAIIIPLASILGAAIWLAIPGQVSPATRPPEPLAGQNKRPSGSTEGKLRSIRLPAFKVEDISVAEFVDYLRGHSIASDGNPGDFPGVDIRIMPPHHGFQEDAEQGRLLTGDYRIRELALPSMTLEEVIRHAFEKTKIRYAVRDEVLWIHGPADHK